MLIVVNEPLFGGRRVISFAENIFFKVKFFEAQPLSLKTTVNRRDLSTQNKS